MMRFDSIGLSIDNENKLIYVCPVDDNFFDFYNIPIVAGNSFPEFHGNDSLPENYIVNEKAIEYLGWKPEEAIGRPFKLLNPYMSGKMGRIVGVVKDFQPSSMKQEIRPYAFFQKSVWLFSAQIRYDTTQTDACIQLLADTWKDIYPDYPLKYTFVDELYKDIYKGEFQLKNMSILLCILALILSATGLFGITAITYQARTKEIGIRKVNGAKSFWLIKWLLTDIVKVISISILLTIPVSYFLMQHWLNNYVVHITPGVPLFLYTSLSLIALAMLTVGWQTWKTANRNPVEALRYE